MATKTGIGSLKHKLSGLRRNSAKVLKKTNSLVSGAISQLKRADKPKAKPKAAAPVRRKAKESAKPVRSVKPASRPAAKSAGPEAAAAPKKTRNAAAAPAPVVVAAPPAPVAANDTKPLSTPVAKTIRAAAAAAVSPVKTVVAPLQQRVGSVLDFQLPSMPGLRRLAPMKPSPDSRASRATSKGKHAALTSARAAAIHDAGAPPAEDGHETV